MNVAIVAGLFVLGLVLGSFVNALVWRLHMHEPELSILRGRSVCTRCRHPLGPPDLVPVLSWLLLRGRCRYCGQPIEDSPFVELSVAALFALSAALWPSPLGGAGLLLFAAWLAIVVALVTLVASRLRWR